MPKRGLFTFFAVSLAKFIRENTIPSTLCGEKCFQAKSQHAIGQDGRLFACGPLDQSANDITCKFSPARRIRQHPATGTFVLSEVGRNRSNLDSNVLRFCDRKSTYVLVQYPIWDTISTVLYNLREVFHTKICCERRCAASKIADQGVKEVPS